MCYCLSEGYSIWEKAMFEFQYLDALLAIQPRSSINPQFSRNLNIDSCLT